MNLDWYFKNIEYPLYQLDTKAAERALNNRKVLFTATSVDDMKTHLLNPTNTGWQTALKASSAIPYVYKQGVNVDGKALIDGGVTAPLPIQEAYELGAQTIVTIKTTTTVQPKLNGLLRHSKPLIERTPYLNKMAKIYRHHYSSYRQAELFVAEPPANVNVITLEPKKPLRSRVLNSSKQDLIADYKLGLETGTEFLKSIKSQAKNTRATA
jgi:predicted patatin/cPLA2 family phospholipase